MTSGSYHGPQWVVISLPNSLEETGHYDFILRCQVLDLRRRVAVGKTSSVLEVSLSSNFIMYIRRNLPNVAPRILHHSATVAIGHDGRLFH
jgi:hypothetical protein